MASVTADVPRATGSLRRRRDSQIAWIFSAPALILLTVFLLIPFVLAIYLSFTDQRLVPGPLATRFVGARNYLRLLEDATLQRALFNNFLFALIIVPVQSAFALFLAILVNQKLRGITAFRTIFFSPVVTTMAVIAIVWAFLYNPEQGLINALLRSLSFGAFQPVDWLGDTRLAFPAIMFMSIWQGVGFQMIIFLAGLQEIPEALYEASSIDGAGTWSQFTSITLPQLRNTLIFVGVSTTIMAFKLFTQVEVMTKGGPQDSTVTTVLHIVQQGFRRQTVGYASAVAVVFFVIVLIISIIQRRVVVEESQVA